MADYQPTSGAVVALSCIVCAKPFTHITKRGRYARLCSASCRVKRRREQRGTKHYARKVHHRRCLECRAPYTTTNSQSACCGDKCSNLRRKRLSDATRTVNAQARLTRKCQRCAETFVMPRPSAAALRGEVRSGLYCSRRCANDGIEYASRGDARRARKHRRRARVRCLPSERFAPSEIFERDGWRCGVCLCSVDGALAYPNPMSASLDHVIPLSKGGAHTRDNTQCAHLQCNVAKGAKLAA